MIEVLARLALAAVLLLAAGLKLAQPRASAAAMAAYGFGQPAARWAAWGGALAAELALAAGVALGSDMAAYLAAAVMIFFALLMGGALMAGRAGASCACFGPRSTLGPTAILRNLALAAAFLALPQLPGRELSAEAWLGLGLALCIAGLIGLGIAVLALAREIGVLRMRLNPASDAALEIPEEGPPLGEKVAWPAPPASPGGPEQGNGLRLAVFLSEGCHICRSLEPRIRAFARNPVLDAAIFDETADAAAWRAFAVPGSPYAVAADGDGTALAKGTFNTLAQLEGILATAERRRAGTYA